MPVFISVNICMPYVPFLSSLINRFVSKSTKIYPASFLSMVLSNAVNWLCIPMPLYVDVNFIKLCSGYQKDGWKRCFFLFFLWLRC